MWQAVIHSSWVAGLPLHFYKYNDDGYKTEAIESNQYHLHLLNCEPNPEISSFVFRKNSWSISYCGKIPTHKLSATMMVMSSPYNLWYRTRWWLMAGLTSLNDRRECDSLRMHHEVYKIVWNGIQHIICFISYKLWSNSDNWQNNKCNSRNKRKELHCLLIDEVIK